MSSSIKLVCTGSFNKTEKFLKKAHEASKTINSTLTKYGEKGVAALQAATPIRTGETASSWYYKIEKSGSRITLSFFNSNVNKGVPIAIILQYGHGTNNGGWVQGRDYINPALRPIFDEMVEAIWKEVTGK